tara:strand:+ start:343 stop:543 length:201 start_codon:yes stop_codon:yes gene_type:complete
LYVVEEPQYGTMEQDDQGATSSAAEQAGQSYYRPRKTVGKPGRPGARVHNNKHNRFSFFRTQFCLV